MKAKLKTIEHWNKRCRRTGKAETNREKET